MKNKRIYKIELVNEHNEVVLTSTSKVSAEKCKRNIEKHKRDSAGYIYQIYYFARERYFINNISVSDYKFYLN